MKPLIPFNKPTCTSKESKYVSIAIKSGNLAGNNSFTKNVKNGFEKKLNCPKALLTNSCTSSLEITALLLDISPEDEIIMPSFTFVSTANAFALRGAKIKFVDVNPATMNIEPSKIEDAITPKTKAIIVVHYAGIACEMTSITKIAKKNKLILIEDAAQALLSKYKGKQLGTFGDMATFSFHETKNITSGGERGLLVINNKKFLKKAEMIREKGTNRSSFLRGQVDKYSWVTIGSHYLASELQAAFLLAQLEQINIILKKRFQAWTLYYRGLQLLQNKKKISLQHVPQACEHNAHIFYIKLNSLKERELLREYLNKNKINATFHYIPLHTSKAGKKVSEFIGEDEFTTKESNKLLRLPIYHHIKKADILRVVKTINRFFGY